jgi:membrane-associated protein
MDLIVIAIDFILHLDKHIDAFWVQYGLWLYVLVFAIVFCETGLVVMPWLPGDSLLFVLGALAAAGGPHVGLTWLLLVIAAILGNTSNYWIGYWVGPKVFGRADSKFLSQDMLRKTEAFYAKYGGMTLVLSRFLPFFRTLAPFVAGVGRMPHGRFQLFSVSGGLLWVTLLTFAGYFLGSIPWVKENLSLLIIAAVIVPGLPAVLGIVKNMHAKRRDIKRM